jgi:hypothetical protein
MRQNIDITQISCQTRRELAERFATAARQYSEAVVHFTEFPGKLSQGDYDRLRTAVEKAQVHSERMCYKFEEHVRSHGCQIELQLVTSLADVAPDHAHEDRNGYLSAEA